MSCSLLTWAIPDPINPDPIIVILVTLGPEADVAGVVDSPR